MGVNKVVYGDTPILDLTDSTVTPQNLLSGEVAYSASGNRVVGEVVTTTVVPNPQGTPTGELNTIQIGNDIYEISTSSDEGGYLTADGNCYSTLPVYSDENDILKIQFKFWNKDASADNQTIIGSSFAGNSDYLLYMTVENGEPIYSYAVANNYTYIKAPRSTEDYDDIELGYDYMIVNGTTYTSQAPAKHSVHRPICVFGSNYRGSGTIGEIKIYKSDVLTYDLVPSLWTGNVGRFIDVLNNDTPYPSEGTSDYGYIGTSSGTTVIANPEGEATDTLTKIQIGDDIYEIAGGSGGGGTAKALVMKTMTWTGDGQSSKSITFDKKPLAIFNIWGKGEGANVYCLNSPFVYGETNYFISSFSGGMLIPSVTYSNDGLTMTMSGADPGYAFNCANAPYTMWYLDEEEVGGGGSASWKDITGTLTAGQTQIVLTSSEIEANSVVNPYASKVGVKASDMVIANGSVTLTFPVQTEDLDVMVRVTKVSGTSEPTPIDTTNTSKYNESSMNVVSSSSQMASVWNGGNAIGLTFYLTNPIDVTNLSKLYYELQTSSCYGGGSQAQQERWNVQIGLMATAPSAILNGTYSELNFVAGDDFSNSNTNYGTQEIDVSSLSGTYYLVINAHGWNAIISNLREE